MVPGFPRLPAAVVEFDLPPPFKIVVCIPPLSQDPSFAAGKQDGEPDVRLIRPDILAQNMTIANREARNRRLGGRWQVNSFRGRLRYVIWIIGFLHCDSQDRWRRMNQHDPGRIDPAPRKRNTGCTRLRIP